MAGGPARPGEPDSESEAASPSQESESKPGQPQLIDSESTRQGPGRDEIMMRGSQKSEPALTGRSRDGASARLCDRRTHAAVRYIVRQRAAATACAAMASRFSGLDPPLRRRAA